jgi:hypothetical protein
MLSNILSFTGHMYYAGINKPVTCSEVQERVLARFHGVVQSGRHLRRIDVPYVTKSFQKWAATSSGGASGSRQRLEYDIESYNRSIQMNERMSNAVLDSKA